MEISRRQALTAGTGAAVGVVGALAASEVRARLDENTPLPFYGSAASAIRPDRSAPGAAGTSVVWSGPGTASRVALTFDDGPHPQWTPRVLAALAAADVPATFFCMGRNVRDHGDLHKGSVGRHELANHTFEHPDLGRLARDRCGEEIARTSELMERTYGSAPTLFRPPYGHLGGAALLAAAEAGLTTVLWSAQAREDLVAARPDGIVDDVAGQVRPGSIVLAHDTGPDDRLITIDRLPRVIERLRADGYTFVTVSDLLAGSSAAADGVASPS
jgi:peptidoglycan/xylan/chitin deacetylase (PgdA/CDA1 family)